MIIVVRKTQTPTIKFLRLPMQTLQIIKKTENINLSTHPVRPVVKPAIPQRNVTLEQTQLIDRLPQRTAGRTESGPTKKCPKRFRWDCSICSAGFKRETPCLNSGAACDRPETTETAEFQPIFEVV